MGWFGGVLFVLNINRFKDYLVILSHHTMGYLIIAKKKTYLYPVPRYPLKYYNPTKHTKEAEWGTFLC